MKSYRMAGSRATSKLQLISMLLAMFSSANAVSFPIQARSRSSALMKRMVDMHGSFGNGSVSVSDFGDIHYATNITLGGAQFEVAIDTGSTDLWVVGDVPHTKNLTILSDLTYGSGAAVGYINTADLEFDGFTISSQAYLHAVPANEFPATLLNTSLADSVGILGLGPSSASTIRRQLGNTSIGDPPLDRIFLQNTSTSNFISFLLPREANDDDFASGERDARTGQLTIGEYVPGLGTIKDAKKLPALVDQFSTASQHWTTLLDSNGIIGPDGERISTNTSIKNPTNGSLDQLHVVFDTGFTFPQLPREIVDAIYGRIPGAEFIEQFGALSNFWRIPCDYEVNVTFLFAGVEYPISPLDLSVVGEADDDGNPTACLAGYQQTLDNIAGNPNFGALDAILGMGFLRNTYTLVNFGDFVDGSNTSVADPFIQLLSMTNASSAHLDFVNQRLGGIDTTGSQPKLLPVSEAKHSPTSNSTTAGNSTVTESPASAKDAADIFDGATIDTQPFYQRTWFIIVASVGGAVILGLVGCGIFAFSRRRRSNVRSEGSFAPQMVGASAYRPLLDGQSAPGSSHSKHDSAWHAGYDEPQYITGGKYGS